MSRIRCRAAIAGVVAVVALFSSRPADAQLFDDAGRPRQPSLFRGQIPGAQYEIANLAMAERDLANREERAGQEGHPGAADRNARRIESLRYRIVVDHWLIRKQYQCDPGNYPYPLRLDPISCAAISQYRPGPLSPYRR